ncbi:transposase [Streptomyces sp. MUSC 14]|uniref:transposase n=1 Tax=Streptomyces sp. MUSC 14 TaxID=1354889 RepID=UPI0015A522E5
MVVLTEEAGGPHRYSLSAARRGGLRPQSKRVRAGRKRYPHRLVFQGILFVLHTGLSWEHLHRELALASDRTCRRRLAERTEAGPGRGPSSTNSFCQAPQRERPGLLRAAVDGSRVRASTGGAKTCGAKTGRPRRPAQDGQRASADHRLYRHPSRRNPDAVPADRGYDHHKPVGW